MYSSLHKWSYCLLPLIFSQRDRGRLCQVRRVRNLLGSESFDKTPCFVGHRPFGRHVWPYRIRRVIHGQLSRPRLGLRCSAKISPVSAGGRVLLYRYCGIILFDWCGVAGRGVGGFGLGMRCIAERRYEHRHIGGDGRLLWRSLYLHLEADPMFEETSLVPKTDRGHAISG